MDFTNPYSNSVRRVLCDAAREAGLSVHESGTYGVTQGPRLETAAEIDRMERDGCTVVGMTGMPESALARERELAYGCCALVVNPAAGRGDGEITMDQIRGHVEAGMTRVRELLEQAVRLFPAD